MVENTNNGRAEQSSEITVSPVDSPSKNYLVEEHMQKMPSIFARGLFYIIVLLLFVSLLYTYLAKIDVVAECRSVVRPSSHIFKIISDRNGYIEKVYVSEGELVAKDMPLFLIRSKETMSYVSKVEELRRTIPFQEEHYNMQISVARDRLKQRENQHANTLKVLNLKLEQNQLTLESMKFDLAYWEKEVTTLSGEAERTKNGVTKGYMSLTQYNKMLSSLEFAKTEVRKFNSQQNITIKGKTIIGEEISKELSDYTNEKAILEKEISNLEVQKNTTLHTMKTELQMNEEMLSIKGTETGQETYAAEMGNIIWAEKAGTVSELYFRNSGEYVGISNLLCTIVPDGSPLYMDITVANRDIGFIEKDMEIKYKIDAFPYTDYGLVRGKVLTISPSAVEDVTLGFVYHVHGTLGRKDFQVKEKHYPIKAGMTATAELVKEKKSILSILIGKLKK